MIWVLECIRCVLDVSGFTIPLMTLIVHYSVSSEYSHYSVGFEFRIFATIRSEANIRLRNYYSKTESSNRIPNIRNSVDSPSSHLMRIQICLFQCS